MSIKPNLFIVGAAKSGTTSLYHYLKAHPDIYFSPIKEPNFFSTDINIKAFSTNYKRNTFLDVDKYFKQKDLSELPLTFIRNHDHYQRLFENKSGFKIRGEASTSYLYSKVAAQNNFDFKSDAKIIIILRNPVERAFSHYQMALRYGFTKLNLREAINNEIKERDKGWGISELYIELGLYFDQLKRYFDVFPKDQIKILFFDDLKANPQNLVNECFNFLGIRNIELDDSIAYNVKELPKNVPFNYYATRSGLKSFLRKVLPKSTRNIISKRAYKGSEIKIGKEDFYYLMDFYSDEIQNVSKLLDKNLDHWLTYNT